MLGGIIYSYSNFNRTICEQTVVTLTGSYILQLLTCVCAVCLCPTKKDARLSRLICNFVVENHEHDEDRFSHDKVNVWTKAFTKNGSQLQITESLTFKRCLNIGAATLINITLYTISLQKRARKLCLLCSSSISTFSSTSPAS